MKKLLIAIPLVVAASWAGASYYTGAQTQSAYDQLLVQLNDLKPFTLVNEQYHTGLVNSTAITKVMDSSATDAKVLFRLHHAIKHSPIGVNESGVRAGAATIITTLVKDDSLPESLAHAIKDFKDAEPFQINTNIDFDGTAVNQFVVSAYERQYDEIKVTFDGIDYTSTLKGDSFVGAGTIGKLSVVDDNGELTLSTGAVKTDLTRISQAVYTGLNGIMFDNLSVTSEKMADAINLKTISLNSDTRLDNGTLDSNAVFAVGDISSPLPINSASLKVDVTGLSIAGLQEYIEKASLAPMIAVDTVGDPDMASVMLDAYKKIIGPGTTLEYIFNVSNDGGDAKLSYGISVVESSSPNYPIGGFDSVSSVRDLLNMIKLEAHLDADVEAVSQTPLAMFIAAPEAQQFIVSDGESYKADVTVSDMMVDINGDPISLDIMMGDLLDMPLTALMQM